MKNYVQAENLKQKGSFLEKFIFISPLFTIILAYLLMPYYFTVSSYNWRYIIIFPATLSLIVGMIHNKDDGKLSYRAIFSLNLDLKKIWISKIMIASLYVFLAIFIQMLGVFLLQFAIEKQASANYDFANLFFASLCLFITNLWQIPFCLFLAIRIGFIGEVLVNSIFAIGLGTYFADTSAWIFCPYSWGIRSMVPLLKILPNGNLTGLSNPLLINTNLFLPLILSFLLLLIGTRLTSKRFSKLEVN